jgi:phosphate transport system substrate-binding protein
MMKKVWFAVVALVMTISCNNLVWAGNLRIDGSTTVLPIAQKAAEAYMKEHPQVSISVSGGGSGNGIKAIIDGTTDIADSSRFIKDGEVKQAIEKGSYPVPFAVAYDCIVPVVHPGNPVKNLTVDQLRGIYKGEIDNWKAVGGPDLKIVVVSRDTSSGTYEVWEEKVMNKERVSPAALLQASSGAVAQAVAGNKFAIGYLGVGYLNDKVKALTVNDIVGNEETTLNGTFPVARPLFMFTRGWPTGDALNFVNYMMHPQKGQKWVKEAGFVPLY